MTQVRVMDDDADLAREVLDRLLAAVERPGSGLRAGSVTQLRHRGGGGRFVVDLAPDDGPLRAEAERVYPGRRALPPA